MSGQELGLGTQVVRIDEGCDIWPTSNPDMYVDESQHLLLKKREGPRTRKSIYFNTEQFRLYEFPLLLVHSPSLYGSS
jgi:hypothetical protein